MKPFLIGALLTIAVSGCATVSQEHRLTTNIQSLEFNSILSEYRIRPTFVTLQEMNDGTELFKIEMDSYQPDKQGINPSISISRKYLNNNIDALNKYLKWNEIALNRKDQFTKNIDKVKAWDNSSFIIENEYTFHSGNENKHYVSIVTCALDNCNPSQRSPIMLDSNNVKILLNELNSFQESKLKKVNIDNVYN